MIGSTVGHYRIVEKIGEGGMGEVFLAEDASLHRRVALKFLPAPLQQDAASRRRLIREARSAAALDHPYICHINEVGEAGDRDFIVMEFVPGESLAEVLARGPLPPDMALRTSLEIAEALEAAHAKGIIHRDIKPGNVMLTPSGHAKVMDFGLAKEIMAPEETARGRITALTTEGAPVGTPAYMSPEQLRGVEADARSDIWALGVTLYEMVAGLLPFQGRSSFEVSEAILNRAPRPLPPRVPELLGAVIHRCLQKDPRRRYRSVTEVRDALEAVRAGRLPLRTAWRYRLARRPWVLATAGLAVIWGLLVVLDVGGLRVRLTGNAEGEPGAIRLAVLPFQNLTGDIEQEYLIDGLTEEMITQLGRLHPQSLSVIGSPSVIRYKNSGIPVDQIGRELNLDYVLAGSARLGGGRIRVTAELIRVRGETQVWTDVFEREMSGILAVQTEVAREVARALSLTLLPAEEARLANARAVDPAAYEAFQKGTHYRRSLTRSTLDAAEQYYRLALEIDPTYAAAWAGIARVWNGRGQMRIVPVAEAYRNSREAILEALAMDPDEWEAHRALAGVLTWGDWDWPAAEREWQRVMELAPNDAETLSSYSNFLMHLGRTEEALEMSRRALELDPFNVKILSFHVIDLLFVRRFDEAIEVAREALRLQPDAPVARNGLYQGLFLAGRYEEAIALDRAEVADDPELAAAVESGYQERGFAGAEKRLADAMAARQGLPGGPAAFDLAVHYLFAGDADRSLEWLHRAFQERDGNMPYLGLPTWDPLRSDPRFQELWRRVGLPQ